MNGLQSALLSLPTSVRQDVLEYRATLRRFEAGEIRPIAFKAYRVPMGIYEQRENGRFMIRVRLGAGLATPMQLRTVAKLARRYSDDKLHFTTRQDIQIHGVRLQDTAAILDGLLTVGLSSRGGGGNTVRNVSASPRAGVDPEEAFDVRPYAIATAEYLLQFRSSFNLPRKYKIAYCGRHSPALDDTFASVADLGFFAEVRDGVSGFRVYAGGGLGANPRIAVRILDWCPADRCIEVAEAVRRVFDEHGDRSNKHAARLRYVVGRMGEEAFAALCRTRVREVHDQGLEGCVPEFRPFPILPAENHAPEALVDSAADLVLPEQRKGFYSIRLNPRFGEVSPEDLERIAAVAEAHGDGLARASQQQNVFLCGIPGGQIPAVLDLLSDDGHRLLRKNHATVVACAGAATCRLGLCLSRGLADAIEREVGRLNLPASRLPAIRISGCPNSCANHVVAAIGLEGKARRIAGRLMPFYEVLAGGRLVEGNARLARRLGAVPAKRVPQMLRDAISAADLEPDALSMWVQRYAEVPEPLDDDLFVDWTAAKPFSLAGRGPGECSVGVMDVIRVDLDAARNALEQASSKEAAGDAGRDLCKAVLAAARALLPIFGLEPRTNREVVAAFREKLVTPGWVAPQTGRLLDAVVDWQLGDRDSLRDQQAAASELVCRVEALFRSLDANLKFRLEPYQTDAAGGSEHAPESYRKDLRGVVCPLNFVRAKVALEEVPVGATLEVLLDAGEAVRNVPASFERQGQEVVAVEPMEGYYCVRIRRSK